MSYPEPFPFQALADPRFGLFAAPKSILPPQGEPQVAIRQVRLRGGAAERGLLGVGVGVTGQQALAPAFGEALERFCARTFVPGQVLVASPDELGADAVSPTVFAACSKSETADPGCRWVRPDPAQPIRWVRGLALSDGRKVWLPLVAVYLAPPAMRAERFLHPISTGCAVAAGYHTATLAALLEVVERDSLSILWLQQLALPRVSLSADRLGELGELYQRGPSGLRVDLFDATTDLGLPTVYGVRHSCHDRKVSTVVACSCALDPVRACRKVLLELAATAEWIRGQRASLGQPREFNRLHQGATFMARKAQKRAFRFLGQSDKRRTLDQIAAGSPASANEEPAQALRKVVKALHQKEYEAYAADLSTDECLRAELRAVRVVVPGLMPFSWVSRARFLAHPRLYQAPVAMGYAGCDETGINPWPQPFG